MKLIQVCKKHVGKSSQAHWMRFDKSGFFWTCGTPSGWIEADIARTWVNEYTCFTPVSLPIKLADFAALLSVPVLSDTTDVLGITVSQDESNVRWIGVSTYDTKSRPITTMDRIQEAKVDDENQQPPKFDFASRYPVQICMASKLLYDTLSKRKKLAGPGSFLVLSVPDVKTLQMDVLRRSDGEPTSSVRFTSDNGLLFGHEPDASADDQASYDIRKMVSLEPVYRYSDSKDLNANIKLKLSDNEDDPIILEYTLAEAGDGVDASSVKMFLGWKKVDNVVVDTDS